MIGGGPAGATAARLLALRGWSVALQHKPPAAKHSLAETLPPSIRNVFHLVGIQKEIDGAGFYRTTGNTSWWGSDEPRVERYARAAAGYQVLRADFDRLLLGLAEKVGVQVISGDSSARFTLDCSGRAGVLARKGLRVAQPGFRTLALCGVWRGSRFPADPTHTLVETYRDGWAWSIPLSPEARYVTFMVDAKRPRPVYLAELEKTVAFRKLLARAVLEGRPWGCDASLYSARGYAGEGFLLVGDAASFVDPLSSFGVKKAMTSAWVAAAVVNTCLKRPAAACRRALAYFEQCERQVYADHLREAGAYFREAAARYASPFWLSRAQLGAGESFYKEEALRAALDRIKRAPQLRLHRAPGVRREQRPVIEEGEVVLRDALAAPGLPPGLEYFHGVSLTALMEMAETCDQVPGFFAAYNRQQPSVALSAFLTALSLLIATGALEIKRLPSSIVGPKIV